MIVVDVETGGLDPRKDALLSIGAIDFDTLDTFSINLRPFPGKTINKHALEINGFKQEDLDKGEDLKKGLEWFFGWCNSLKTDYTIAGENPAFDRDFIDQACKDVGLKNPFGHRTVDLHSLAYGNILRRNEPGLLGVVDRKNKLNADKIFEYCGLPAEPRPHIALNGAKWETEAFRRLLYGGMAFFYDFVSFPVPEFLLPKPVITFNNSNSVLPQPSFMCTCFDNKCTACCPIHPRKFDITGSIVKEFHLT